MNIWHADNMQNAGRHGREHLVIERKSLQPQQTGKGFRTGRRVVGSGDTVPGKSLRTKKQPAVLISFFMTALLLTALYAVLGFYPFGSNSVILSDLGAQYAPDLIAYKNQLLSGGFHTYSFALGMGKNTLGVFAYYLASPLNFITFLFPDQLISEAVLVLITVKLALASAFMTLFLRRRFHTQSWFAIVFGIMYATCSYSMVYMINIMWLDGFFLLPLLLTLIELFLADRRHWTKVTAVLLVLFVSGFYIAYMVGIFSFLYLLARLFEEKKLSARNSGWTVLSFIGSALLAAGMSAAVLIPAGLDILGNADQTARELSLESNFKFISFLNQVLAGSFDSLSSNKPLVYSGLAALFLCILFFANPYFPRRQKTLAGGAVIFFILSFNFSFLDIAWQLFDAPNWFLYRYSFLFIFVLLCISFASLLHLDRLKPRAFLMTGVIFAAILLIVQGFGDLAEEGDRFYVNLFIGALLLLCLYAMSGIAFPESVANIKKLVPALFAVILCVEVVFVNPLYMRPKMFGGEAKREPIVSAMDQADDLVLAAEADAGADSVPFYRMDTDGSPLNGLNPMSAGLYLNFRSVSTFNSSSNKELSRLLKQLGFQTNYNYFSATHMYSSVVTDSLLGVRYILSEKENFGGYELAGTSADGKLFLQKNNSALPLMYLVEPAAGLFDFFASEKEPESKNPFVFQDELLVSLFGEEAFAEPVYYGAEVSGPVLYNAIRKEAKPEPADKTDEESDEESDGESSAKDVDLLGQEPVDEKTDYGETYLRISDDEVLSLTYSIKVTGSDPLLMSIPALSKNDQAEIYVDGVFYTDLTPSFFTQIISLGSYKPGDTVTVSVRSGTDSYSMLSALFYHCDADLFASELNTAAGGQGVQITRAEDGHVNAQITAGEDRLLLTTIPYEKGWTLWVDDVKTEIVPYQDALISVPVTEGTHTIVLSFEAPGIRAGATISGAACLVFVGALVFTQKKRGSML